MKQAACWIGRVGVRAEALRSTNVLFGLIAQDILFELMPHRCNPSITAVAVRLSDRSQRSKGLPARTNANTPTTMHTIFMAGRSDINS
jgi:hypothetical protein